MAENKNVLIKNIYYMLSYAFQTLRQNDFENITAEDYENIHDLFAAILSKGVSRQLKQGLHLEYTVKTEDTPTLKGKLNMIGTARHKMCRDQKLSCSYDELTENNILNQILKTTMYLLTRCESVKKEHRASLKKELILFQDISLIAPSDISWERIRFQRLNQNYRMLTNICNMVLQGLLMTSEDGTVKFARFVDEQRMCRLYEKFILEYYRYHYHDIRANADQVKWNLDDGLSDFLPIMQTDITLRKGEKVLILDAKYYTNNMQKQFDAQTFHSGNIYQIYTYVKNMDVGHTGTVAGMLLYAKTEDQIQPKGDFMMDGNKISVRTLDLNLPFDRIKEQLNKIADTYFQ